VSNAQSFSGTRLEWVEEKIWRSGLSLLFLLCRAHQVHMIHYIDHLGSCQQRMVTPSS
jgi:hypothetical protein